jgi:hypothetical protein
MQLNRPYITVAIIGLFASSFMMAQTTLKGYVTQYEHGDTVVNCKIYNRTLVLNKKGEEIHKEWKPYSHTEDEQALTHFTTVIGESDNYINGWEQDGQTKSFTYIHDTLNSRYYIIEDQDTNMVYQTTYDAEKRLIRKECINGCNYRHDFSYANPVADTLVSVMSDGRKSYSIYEFDSQRRPVLYKFNMESPQDEHYSYTKIKYKDQVRMQVTEHGSTNGLTKEVITTFKDKKGNLVYETFEIFVGDDKRRWVIEYEIQ